MPEKERTVLRLDADHGWRAAANHKILVLDRGAVRLDYPETWVVEATEDCVKICDRPPPDGDCVLGVSFHRWPVIGATLPVATLVREALESDERALSHIDPIHEEARTDTVLAWGQGRFVDRRVDREACARLCIARKGKIQALLTFDFWLSDLAVCHARWSGFLSNLRLGQWVADARRGPLAESEGRGAGA